MQHSSACMANEWCDVICIFFFVAFWVCRMGGGGSVKGWDLAAHLPGPFSAQQCDAGCPWSPTWENYSDALGTQGEPPGTKLSRWAHILASLVPCFPPHVSLPSSFATQIFFASVKEQCEGLLDMVAKWDGITARKMERSSPKKKIIMVEWLRSDKVLSPINHQSSVCKDKRMERKKFLLQLRLRYMSMWKLIWEWDVGNFCCSRPEKNKDRFVSCLKLRAFFSSVFAPEI